jgi:uncharacterized coiled-coil protein SlyX
VAARDRHVSARGASRSLVGMPWTRTTSQRPPGIMGHRLVGTRFLKGTSSQKSVEGEEIAAARVAVAKWKELNLKRAEEGDMMGAADADIKMYEAKAELARLQGDPVAEQEAKIAKQEAKIAKQEAGVKEAITVMMGIADKKSVEYEIANEQYTTAKASRDKLTIGLDILTKELEDLKATTVTSPPPKGM